ncbi:MAG: ribonuclease [Erythrobacter sp.]
MAEWVKEEGIGETRALLIEGGEVVAAKLHWPGELTAGEVRTAQLTTRTSGSRRGSATLENGSQVLVDHLPRDLNEGASFDLRISRAPIAEKGRLKRAQGRFVTKEDAASAAPETPIVSAKTVRQFPAGLWEDVWHATSGGTLEFTGGEILCSATPAMTLIDIDCGRPEEAYFNSIPVIARVLQWFDLGGNIGIDFPSVTDKGDRRAIDARLGEYLADWPHERTAMNGFGFVQLVARLEGPSLLHRFATSRVGMCVRYALRMAEQVEGIGPALLLQVHPALKAKLRPAWLEELARRTGREVRIEADHNLALEAPNAQILSA